MSLNRCTAAMRSSGDSRGHSPSSKAVRAAATARSMSAVGALGHPADDLFGVGRDDLDDVGAGGIDPLAADEELLVDLHGLSPVCRIGLVQTVISPRATLPAHG